MTLNREDVINSNVGLRFFERNQYYVNGVQVNQYNEVVPVVQTTYVQEMPLGFEPDVSLGHRVTASANDDFVPILIIEDLDGNGVTPE